MAFSVVIGIDFDYPDNRSHIMHTLSTGSHTVITPEQCRMARAARKLGVRDLAALAGVSAMTITRFENEQSGGQAETLRKLQAALESAGLEFIAENGGGPGVRLKRGG